MANNSSQIFTEPPGLASRFRLVRRLPLSQRLAAADDALAACSGHETPHAAGELLAAVRRVVEDEADAGRRASSPASLRELLHAVSAALRRSVRTRLVSRAASALVRNWSKLSAPQRADAARLARTPELAHAWRAALRRCPGFPEARDRISAAEAIADGADPAVARPLAVLLLDRDATVADAAEHALRRLADAAADRPVIDLESDADFDAALADAARTFREHRRRGVLAIAAARLDLAHLSASRRANSPLAAWFADAEHESHLALRAVVRRSNDPRLRARAWEWLGDHGGSLIPAALERLARSEAVADHEAVLPRAHLSSNPARARRAAMIPITPASGVLPARGAVPALSRASRRGLPRFAASLRLPASALPRVLEPLLTDPDSAARHAAARFMPAGLGVDYCFDPDERVARHASLRVASAGASDPSGEQPAWRWRALARSPHPFVRLVAWGEADRLDPWRAGAASSRIAARRRLAREPDRFMEELRARCANGDPADRAGAIALARSLGLAQAVEPAILSAVEGRDESGERPASAAAAALGDLASDAAQAALSACLSHPVPRVRANAVEAAARASRRRGDPPGSPWRHALVELKHDAHHRVRANALHALAALVRDGDGTGASEDDLAAMLGDDRPMHRVAALWVAERVLSCDWYRPARWNTLAARIADMARAEPEPAVRLRAEWCARRALAAMRARWRGRAMTVGSGGAP